MKRVTKADSKAETSRVMRVSGENFERFTALKEAYAKKNRLKRVTYDSFMHEFLLAAQALLAGSECYLVGNKVYDDLAEARGQAIMSAVEAKQPPVPPVVCVKLGEDNGLVRS